MSKKLYGPFRYNVEFSRGMKRIRTGINNRFEIITDSGRHIFKKIGDFVERHTVIFTPGRRTISTYAYFNLKARRICPEHLVPVVKVDDLIRKCPVEDCKYSTEKGWYAYGYEDIPSKVIYEKAGLTVKPVRERARARVD